MAIQGNLIVAPVRFPWAIVHVDKGKWYWNRPHLATLGGWGQNMVNIVDDSLPDSHFRPGPHGQKLDQIGLGWTQKVSQFGSNATLMNSIWNQFWGGPPVSKFGSSRVGPEGQTFGSIWVGLVGIILAKLLNKGNSPYLDYSWASLNFSLYVNIFLSLLSWVFGGHFGGHFSCHNFYLNFHPQYHFNFHLTFHSNINDVVILLNTQKNSWTFVYISVSTHIS